MGEQYKQAKRVASIEPANMDKDTLLLRRMTGVDRVGQPFNYFVEALRNPGKKVDYSKLVGRKIKIKLRASEDGKTLRYFNGYVIDARYSGPTSFGMDAYHLLVAPWFWLLKKTSNCRIFRNKNVEQILTAVFKTLKASIAEFSFSLEQDTNLEKYEHIVQYNETDFAFASRLMEEKGIYYYFDHKKNGKHEMILISSKGKQKNNPTVGSLNFTKSRVAAVDNNIFRWQHRHQVVSDAFFQRDSNFSSTKIDSKEKIPVIGSDESKGKGADPQGGFGAQCFTNYYYEAKFEEGISKIQSKASIDLEKGLTQSAELRAGASLAERDIIFADSYCRQLQAGYNFTLKEHPDSKQNKKYFITSVAHQIEVGGYGTSSAPVQNNYRCSITGIPETVQFRPKRITPKAKIYGPQTAIVVAEKKSNKGKIFTDSHGRVKVRFHWDRLKDRTAVDKKSNTAKDNVKTDTKNLSGWIRVARGAAGNQWGMSFVPRVGQEVVVDFLEGDPDRPIISGTVHNAKMLPPYLLPDFGEISTIKTKVLDKKKGAELKDSTAFNEIRLYDRKSSEQIFIHAARAMDIQVEGNYREKVGGNMHLVVADTKTKKEYSDDKKTGYRFVTVQNNDFLETGMNLQHKVGGSYILSTEKSATIHTKSNLLLTGGAINVVTAATCQISAGGSVNISSPLGVTLSSGPSCVSVLPAGIGIKGPIVDINGALGVPIMPVPCPPLPPGGVSKPRVQEAAENTGEINRESGKIQEKKIKLGKISK